MENATFIRPRGQEGLITYRYVSLQLLIISKGIIKLFIPIERNSEEFHTTEILNVTLQTDRLVENTSTVLKFTRMKTVTEFVNLKNGNRK